MILGAETLDDTTTINETPKPSTFDILTRLFEQPYSADNFAVSRHRPTDQLGDTQADPRKNKTPHRTKNEFLPPHKWHIWLCPAHKPTLLQSQKSHFFPTNQRQYREDKYTL